VDHPKDTRNKLNMRSKISESVLRSLFHALVREMGLGDQEAWESWNTEHADDDFDSDLDSLLWEIGARNWDSFEEEDDGEKFYVIDDDDF